MKGLSLSVLALFALLGGCGQGPSQPAPKSSEEARADGDGHAEGEGHEEHEEAVRLTPDQAAVAGIRMEPARIERLQPELSVPGTVESTVKGRAAATPAAPGRIARILVSLGEKVRQGQPLAVIDSSELAGAWASVASADKDRDAARSAVREAEAQAKLAASRLAASKAHSARQASMAQSGAFSQGPLQQAQSELNDAESEALSLGREEASHQDQLRRLEALYRDGIVSRAEVEAARLEVQQDRIRLERARSRASLARTAWQREKAIADKGLLNAREVQAAEADVRAAGLELERARIAVKSAQSALAASDKAASNARAVYAAGSSGGRAAGSRVTTLAPIAGTVAAISVTQGQAVDRTQTLMEIENLDSVWVTAGVPEKDVLRAVAGARVRIEAPSIGGRSFEGRIDVVGARMDPKTRTLPVRCLVSNAGGLLKPGMFAAVRIPYGTASPRLTVPSSAVMSEGDEKLVFVRHEEGWERREVKTGRTAGGLTEVLSGISPGDLVVAEGAFVLQSELKKGELKGHEH